MTLTVKTLIAAIALSVPLAASAGTSGCFYHPQLGWVKQLEAGVYKRCQPAVIQYGTIKPVLTIGK